MKKRIRFLALTLSLLVMLSVFSVCSILAGSTDIRYMNGYKMYGSLWDYSDEVTASTYCENIGYGKKVKIIYHCEIEEQPIEFPTEIRNYVVNGFESLSLTAEYPNRADYIAGVVGQYWVKASDHMYWSSDESGDNIAIPIEYPFFNGE